MRHGRPGSRSTAEWSVRALLATTASVAGYFAVTHAMAYASRGNMIERSAALAPYDGRITGLMSELRSAPDVSPMVREQSDRIARAALAKDPTAVAATSTLGINAEIRGDKAAARRFFAYSETLSRRDLRTRLWTIEDAVERGDITAALRSYDIALRTSRNAPDLLYPVLAAAITEPDIRTALVRTLARRPAWGETFTNYVSGSGPDPLATVRLFATLQGLGIRVSGPAQVALINLLLGRDLTDETWSYYRSIRPGVDRRRLRNGDFGAQIDNPTPLDWITGTGDGVSASIQRAERGNLFDFAVAPSTGGLLLRQVQLLPPGEYVLAGRSTGIDQPPVSRPYWSLSCSDGRELGRVEVPATIASNGNFTGRLRVPAGCPVQSLSLVAKPSDAISGVSGQIISVLLRPAN